MAALVQTIPQQTGTVPVLQTRPSSSSGTYASPSSQNAARFQNMSWTSFNAGNSGTYRAGQPVVAPYAFAPNLNHTATAQQQRQSWSPHLRPEHRAFSAPAIQGPPQMAQSGSNARVSHLAAGSVSTSSSSNSTRSYVSKDDSALPSRQPRADQPLRPLSTANLPTPSVMTISSPAGSVKPSPNRYRRSNQRSQSPVPPTSQPTSTSPSPSTPPADEQPAETHTPRAGIPRSNGHNRYSSVDDSSHSERPQPESAKRYRRRSMGNMDPSSYPNLQLQLPISPQQQPASGPYDFIAFDTNQRPQSSHSHRGSVHSTHSSASSAREQTPDANAAGKPEEKRANKPSPLSQPASTSTETPKAEHEDKAETKASSPAADSPAAKRLAELKNDKRPGKSRLRRAFSFGSASELLKATSQSKREAIAAEKARREALREELGDEQAAIAEQQEASGLGESIYSHQGGFFSGSTDALSISSTASSASMMLRKMGKGMKKSTRSLVGMFRPKSVASINSIEGANEPMALPQISVVNVEADRESVAVNPDPMEMPRGGTVFPKVEGPGSEVRRSTSIRDKERGDRKSIVGGDRERAEVLAAVRKGILKKTHSDYGVSSPANALNGSDSPHSSAPPTPNDTSQASPRPTEQVTIAGDDYFLSGGSGYTATGAKSAPITPQGVTGRNIVFSPRIQFHETWPSGEYDRRGDIATCNRLTPLLAQQIREEINNFKMEMEVHENSKIYTHFI